MPTPSAQTRGVRNALVYETAYGYQIVAHLMYTASVSGGCAVLAAAHAGLAWLLSLSALTRRQRVPLSVSEHMIAGESATSCILWRSTKLSWTSKR